MRLCARRSVIIRHVARSTGRLRLLTAPTAQPACAMRAARPRFPRPCTPGSTPRCDARRGGRACRPHVTYWPLRTGDPKAWESRAAGSPSLVPAFPAPSCSSPSALRAASRTRTSAGPSIARSASSTERSSTAACCGPARIRAMRSSRRSCARTPSARGVGRSCAGPGPISGTSQTPPSGSVIVSRLTPARTQERGPAHTAEPVRETPKVGASAMPRGRPAWRRPPPSRGSSAPSRPGSARWARSGCRR